MKLFFLCLAIMVSLSCFGDSVPDNVEYQALKDLYLSTNGANWNNKTNWPSTWPASATSAQFGTWFGVTVVNGDVTGLAYSGNNLTGTLPASLGNFTSLQDLVLSYNNLSGSLPASLGNLGALIQLHVEVNSMSGSIPTTLGNLSNLKILYLQNNQFAGSIPTEIGNLSQLEFLSLASNQLTSNIPSSIGNLTHLIQLYLYNNQLSGSLPATLGNLVNLQELVLSYNNLSGSIPPGLGNLNALTRLHLEVNSLSGSIPTTLGNLSYLKVLYLQNNQLNGLVPSEIGNLSLLEYLNLSTNQLTGSIPPSFGNLSHLIHLVLYNNQLSGSLPSTIGSLSALQALVLSYNSFSGSIPETLGNVNTLTYLYLEVNSLTGSIPASLGNLTNLKALGLQNNQLSGSIPSELGSIQSLEYLNLSSNPLTGSIPSTFGDLTNMRDLIIVGAQLSGSIPTSLGNMIQLRQLLISYNNLSGVVPTSFGNLNQLTHLYLEVNDLSGSIPPTLGNLSNLQVFFAQSNELTGAIPPELNNITTLQNLNLGSNKLTSFPSFLNFPNKSALSIELSTNRIPFGDLEIYYNQGSTPFSYFNSNYQTVDLPLEVQVIKGTSLLISLPNPGQFSTITWQKQVGGNWTNVNASNDDSTQKTFKKTTPTPSDFGTYRVTITNSKVPGSFSSDPVLVTEIEPVKVTLDNLAFQYRYDNRKRMTAKKVPGADWVYMVYDNRDRLVLTQDGEQRKTNKWSVTKYDELNRPIITGIYSHGITADQATMSTLISSTNFFERYDGTPSNHGYTNTIFPTTNVEVLTVTYYDQYAFKSLINQPQYNYDPNDFSDQYKYDSAGNSFPRVAGQVTGSKVKIIGQTDYLWGVTYYDDKYRMIQSISANIRGGVDRSTSVYDFTGKVVKTKTSHIQQSTTQTVVRRFVFDHSGRLLDTWHRVGGSDSVLLVRNVYNELGQLVDKKLHSTDNGTTFEQSVDYRYNIRGWLTSMNNSELKANTINDDTNDLFGMELAYDNTFSGLNNQSLYNGNISAIKWSNNLGLGATAVNPSARAYKFSYDTLNRLKSANQWLGIATPTSVDWTLSGSNHEDGLAYDLNGNILKLNRTGDNGSTMDILTYDYGSSYNKTNRLKKVGDTGDATGFKNGTNSDDDYSYDANGNMTLDKNKGISSINYNYLNLPERVTKSNGDYIKYFYDASGRKLRQEVYTAANVLVKKSDYIGEYFYENDTLKFINHEEGRIIPGTSNLIPNSNSISTINFSQHGGNVALSTEVINGTTYLKTTCTFSGGASTPGAFPVGGIITVIPGQTYILKVRGYRITATNANLYVANSTGADIVWPGALLPLGAANENWVSTTFTVPAGVTSIKIGVLLGLPELGDGFYISKISLTQGAAIVPDVYEYNLKDHLGNVRLTFTTKDEIVQETATLEVANATTEQGQFINYSSLRKVNAEIFDHTYNTSTPTNGAYAMRLNGSANEKIGLAKSLAVMPGDVIEAKVFAKYVDLNSGNPNAPAWQALMALLNSVSSGAAGVVLDGEGYLSAATNQYSFTGILDKTGEPQGLPKAYLNYLFFSKDYTRFDGGYVRVTGGMEDGSNVPHQELTRQIEIKEAGYVYIWLSNENETPVEVYFDDFAITHTKSSIVASDEYYPGGAPYNSFTREGNVENKRKYQSKEWQTDLDLEWYDFGPRQYDPWILQTTTPDPHAENYYRWSPYSWSFNNPTRFVDPTGMDPEEPFWRTIVNFLFGDGNDGSEESASNYGQAVETNRAVSTRAKEAKAELQEAVEGSPLAVIGHTMDAQQSETGGEMAGHLVKAAVSINAIPIAGGGGKAGVGKGTIYKVPGEATSTGKPYIGRHNKSTPQQTRKSNDGRDRTKAEVIDTYDASDPKLGQYKEQKAIDNNGGVKNLDNKRNEVNPQRKKELDKKYGNN